MAIPGTALDSKLSDIVGQGNVSTDPGLLSTYREAGMTAGGDPKLIVRPTSMPQVRELIKLARAEGINLVFSSSAPPRFRGDTVPDGEAMIVDMSGMDQIVRMDRRNKVALIEPGVRFSQLKEAGDKAGLRVLMPLLPRQGKSVLASMLEREPTMIPKYHWDTTDPMLCTEIVFGTGDLFRTGSAAGPGSLKEQWAHGGAQKNPMGPAQTDFARILQGSQGTMGAMTWCTVKMEVKPTLHEIYFVPDVKLPRLIDLTYRAMRPKLGDEWMILNSYALATMIADDPAKIDDLAERQAPYTIVYGISGYEYLPEKRIAYQHHDIGVHAQAAGVVPVKEVPGCSAVRMDRILSGPSPEPYYKLGPRGAFLDIFFLTTLDRTPGFISVMEAQAEKAGYPKSRIGTYIQPIQQGRNVHLEFTIYYDPADPEQARGLFTSASAALSDAGAYFSRPYGPWSGLVCPKFPKTVQMLKTTKKMLDPDNILNRGKICFKEEV